MKESKLLGSLMPSHPDLQPIIHELRAKYQLREIDPDGEPITEIYLGNEIIPLEEFRLEIENMIIDSEKFLPEHYGKLYAWGKKFPTLEFDLEGYDSLPEDSKKAIKALYAFFKNNIDFFVSIFDGLISQITNMVYVYLLTGESEEFPNDWISQVNKITLFDETMILVLASQAANPDAIVNQFKELYKKTFGVYQPKVTDITVSTAYYMRLQRQGKPWNFIVEEFIRLNNFSLPRDRSSKSYADTYRRYERLLRKRIQRSEKVLNILLGDKK